MKKIYINLNLLIIINKFNNFCITKHNILNNHIRQNIIWEHYYAKAISVLTGKAVMLVQLPPLSIVPQKNLGLTI